jgi:hypothetical protein
MNKINFIERYIQKTEELAQMSLYVCSNLCMMPYSCCNTGVCPDMQTYAAKLDILTALNNE